MVNFFTRTADNPQGSSIDDTFELPAKIQRIDVDARPLDRPPIADGRRCPADALAVPEGRRSAQGRRSQEGRPQHRRRPAVSFSSPLRGSQPHADDHLAAAGHDGGDLGHGAERRPRAHAPARVSSLFSALVQDESGQIQAVWPNQAFLKDVIKSQQRIVLFGKVEIWGSRGLQITDPEFEIVKGQGPGIRDRGSGRSAAAHRPHRSRLRANRQRHDQHAAAIRVAGARAVAGRWIRSGSRRHPRARSAGRRARRRCGRRIFPPSDANVDQLNAFMTPAQRRLVFEDFFVFQTGLALRRHENAQVRKGLVSKVDDRIRQCARAVLPFKLTEGQRDALAEIVADMQRAWPMQRLLQGDVGAGKTIVALLAAIVAMENGYQVAFMAPTEILAEQHYRTIVKALDGKPYRVALLSGRVTAATRRDLLPAIERGEINLVVGTQALIQEHVKFKSLALAVIDEQHRFGVVQRGTLAAKGVESRRARDDRDADSAHAGADRVRRHGSVGDSRPAARPPADQDAGQGRFAPRRGLRDDARRDPPRPPGLRDLSARRGVREDRSQGRDRDGGADHEDLSGVRRRAAARPHEGRREGSGDASASPRAS